MKGKRNRGFLNARRRCRPPDLNSSARSSCHLRALEPLRSPMDRLMWKPLVLRRPTAPARIAGEYESNRASESCIRTHRLARACTRRSSNRDCHSAEGNLQEACSESPVNLVGETSATIQSTAWSLPAVPINRQSWVAQRRRPLQPSSRSLGVIGDDRSWHPVDFEADGRSPIELHLKENVARGSFRRKESVA